jgi:outer membrane autotransporter protein
MLHAFLTATFSSRLRRIAMSVIARTLIGMFVAMSVGDPLIAGASTCATGTGAQTTVANGGTCTPPPYTPAGNSNQVGAANVTGGDSITLSGTPAIALGTSGSSMVLAGTVTPVTGSFATVRANLGTQTTNVLAPNAATGTSVVVATYNSANFQDVSNLTNLVPQYTNVNGQEYLNAALGTVAASGGTLNVNLNGNISGAFKQTNLTSADGSGTAASSIVWNSSNTVNMIIDPRMQVPSSSGTLTVGEAVTNYAGSVTFQGTTYTVTNAAQLATYNNALVAALKNGTLTTQAAYNAAFNAAFVNSTPFVGENVTYQSNATVTPPDLALAPNGNRYVIAVSGTNASATVATGAMIDSAWASGGIHGSNGATVTNNGSLSTIVSYANVSLDTGAKLINNGVISAGYLAGAGLNTANPGSTFFNYGDGADATGVGTNVQNNGIINVAGMFDPGNIVTGVGISGGASGANSGTINVGVNPGFTGTVIGVGMNGVNGGTFTNNANGVIAIGRSAQYTPGAATTDVAISGPALGMQSSGSSNTTLTNAGTITIGSLTQGAIAMNAAYETAANNLLVNTGTITINGAAGGIPSSNIGMNAVNTGTATQATPTLVLNNGTINVNGVNNIGMMVESIGGIGANATSNGTINVNGGADPGTGTRNFGMWVEGTNGFGTINGALNLTGTGAIGAFAQDGATINVGANAVPLFSGGSDQIGFYASGAGSTINVDAQNMAVSTTGSELFRVGGGAAYSGSSTAGALNLTIGGIDARGVVATGAGTVLTTGASSYTVTGGAGSNGGAAAIVTEGGATGTIDAATTIALNATGAIAGIVDGQAHDLSGAAIGAAVATALTNNAAITSSTPGVTGFVVQNLGTLQNNGSIALAGAGSTGIDLRAQGTANNAASVTANGVGVLVNGPSAVLTNAGSVLASNGTAGVDLLSGAGLTLSGSGTITGNGTADGLRIDAGGSGSTLTATGATITTTGTGFGVNNLGSGSALTFTNGTITTSGTGAVGLSSSGSGATIALTGTAITTSGANFANGVYVGNGGVLGLTNTPIATTGYQSSGLVIDTGAAATLSGGSVATTNALSNGLFATGAGSRITATNTNVSVLGNASNAVDIENGATAAMTGGTIDANGETTGFNNATSLYVTGAGSRLTVTGSTVTSENSNAYPVYGTTALADGAGTLTLNGVSLSGSGTDTVGVLAQNNATATVNGGTVATSGDHAAGLWSLLGGNITATDAKVTTSGEFAYGAQTYVGQGPYGAGQMTLNGGSVATSGIGSVGLYALGGSITSGNDSTGTGLTVTTIGANTPGAYASAKNGYLGSLALTNATVSTTGANAFGVAVDNGASAVLTGGNVTTSGSGSNGLYVSGTGSTLSVSGTTVNAQQGNAAVVNGGGSLSATGATLTGLTSGIAVTDSAASGATSTVAVNGGTITSGADAFDVSAAKAAITVSGGAGVNAGSGTLLQLANGSNATFTASGENLIGNLLSDATSTGNVFLNNGTTLTGTIDPISLTIDGSSTWNATGNSTLASLTNAGVVNFPSLSGSATAPSSYHTITTGSYLGNNGTITMHTYLGADNSPTDQLVINGGTATGSTTLAVINTGGSGALTVANGIELVDAENGATTAPSAFSLAGTSIRIGAYDYRLFQGGLAPGTDANDWYLRDTFAEATPTPTSAPTIAPTVAPTSAPTSAPTVAPTIAPTSAPTIAPTSAPTVAPTFAPTSAPTVAPTAAPSPTSSPAGNQVTNPTLPTPAPSSPPKGLPIIGPELSVYGAIAPTAQRMGLDTLGTLYDRVGDETIDEAPGSSNVRTNSAWLRAFGGTVGAGYGGITLASTSGSQVGAQAGVDLIRHADTNGNRNYFGAYGAYDNMQVSVNGAVTNVAATQYVQERTGSIYLASYSAGLYDTYFSKSGWYVDTVLQGSEFLGHADSTRTGLNLNGYGVGASVETGAPIGHDPHFAIMPQAQIVWQDAWFGSTADSYGPVNGMSGSTVFGRAGVQLNWASESANWRIRPYVRANLWSTLSGTNSSVAYGGSNGSSVVTTESATWTQIGAGITVKRKDSFISYYAHVDGLTGLSGPTANHYGVDGAIGLKLTW